MAKRRYSFDEKKISKFIKEGRGQGQGAQYRPWLTIQDVPSRGRASRIRGRIAGREHHLFSDGEFGAFLMLDWSDVVTDIREQFPLDREQTRRLASDMGIQHPADPTTGCDNVMTLDFLVDVIDERGCARQVARSIKQSSDLEDARVLEKQELERRYWQQCGVDWGIITERDLDPVRIRNIRWLHEMLVLDDQEAPGPGYWKSLCDAVLSELGEAAPDTSINSVLKRLESNSGYQSGDGLKCFRHLSANKNIAFDLAKLFDIQAPIKVLSINQKNTTSDTSEVA